ncbi:MAG: hypothetical protein ACRC42_01885 [Mycoplasma sp.]
MAKTKYVALIAPFLIFSSLSSLAFVKNAEGESFSQQKLNSRQTIQAAPSDNEYKVDLKNMKLTEQNGGWYSLKTFRNHYNNSLTQFGWENPVYHTITPNLTTVKATHGTAKGMRIMEYAWLNWPAGNTHYSMNRIDSTGNSEKVVDLVDYARVDERSVFYRIGKSTDAAGSVVKDFEVFSNQKNNNDVVSLKFSSQVSQDAYWGGTDRKRRFQDFHWYLEGSSIPSINVELDPVGEIKMPEHKKGMHRTPMTVDFFFNHNRDDYYNIGTSNFKGNGEVYFVGQINSESSASGTQMLTEYYDVDLSSGAKKVVQDSIMNKDTAKQGLKKIENYINNVPGVGVVEIFGKAMLDWFTHYFDIKLTANNQKGVITLDATLKKRAYVHKWKNGQSDINMQNLSNIDNTEFYFSQSFPGFVQTEVTEAENARKYDTFLTPLEIIEDLGFKPYADDWWNFEIYASRKYWTIKNAPANTKVKVKNIWYNHDGEMKITLILDRYFNEDSELMLQNTEFDIVYTKLAPMGISDIVVREKFDNAKVDEQNFFDYVISKDNTLNLDKINEFIQIQLFPMGTTFELINAKVDLKNVSFTIVASDWFGHDYKAQKTQKKWDLTLTFLEKDMSWIIYLCSGIAGVLLILFLTAMICRRVRRTKDFSNRTWKRR